jgi:CubicO group peptidase (beta-lactamase class C family)
MRRLFFALILIVSLRGTTFAANPAPTVAPAPLTAANFAKAAAYSRSHGGLALRVEQFGKVAFEDYAPGYSATTPHKIYSGTKSFVAVTAMILAEKNVIRLDEPASDIITEWKNDARRSITINQLLSQTSGLDPNDDAINSAHDALAAAVQTRLVSAPGTKFHYGAAGYQAFGEILHRKLGGFGDAVEKSVTHLVLDPYDIKLDGWVKDDAGNVLVHAGMIMSAEQWAKFGEAVMRPRYPTDHSRPGLGFGQLFVGHIANPAYGLGFWLNAPQHSPRHQSISDLLPASDGDQLYSGGPRDLVCAMGTGKQRLYVIPSQQLVIVRFTNSAAFSDGDFLSRLLTGKPHPDRHTH